MAAISIDGKNPLNIFISGTSGPILTKLGMYFWVLMHLISNDYPELTLINIIQISKSNQRTNSPVNAHLLSWPSKAQNIQNLENIW